MPQILVRNLSAEAVAGLKELAKSHSRSLEAEVREILETAASRRALREEAIRFADESRRRNGPQRTNSVDLLREDRER